MSMDIQLKPLSESNGQCPELSHSKCTVSYHFSIYVYLMGKGSSGKPKEIPSLFTSSLCPTSVLPPGRVSQYKGTYSVLSCQPTHAVIVFIQPSRSKCLSCLGPIHITQSRLQPPFIFGSVRPIFLSVT